MSFSAEEVGLVLAVVGTVVAVVQVLQNRRNQRNVTQRLTEHEEALMRHVGAALTNRFGHAKPQTVVGEGAAVPRDHDHRFTPAAIAYGDVDNDGYDELLMQHPGPAAYTSVLRVYKMLDGDIRVMDSLASHTHAGFSVGDVDGDGRTEVATLDVRYEDGVGWANSMLEEVLYRWQGKKFTEVGRRELGIVPGERDDPMWFSHGLHDRMTDGA